MSATEEVLASLKDFQRDTADYAFRRLWTDSDWTKRFLVADEVGLGKTMVAKGVIAKTVEHLRDSEERIDIVYICSNSQIARQNLARLNVVGGSEIRHADRLTMLPAAIRELRSQKINFVSFTPGTSFDVGYTSGRYGERVLLYWMLESAWAGAMSSSVRWAKFFQGSVRRRDTFEFYLASFDRASLDGELVESFGRRLAATAGPDGRPLREELEECAEKFTHLRGKPDPALGWQRTQLIGALRDLVARAAVEHLKPNLVILDEFQRFKGVINDDTPAADLARAVMDHEDARVLLLSATPFKMYTLPDEPEGDDHYDDFNNTVEFLAGPTGAETVRRNLRVVRQAAVSGARTEAAERARDAAEAELRRVMCRTERLSPTREADGMLVQRELPQVSVNRADLNAWVALDGVARHLKVHDVFEYWRSTPYALNVMERSTYQLRKNFEAAVDAEDRNLAELLRAGHGLLDWNAVANYRKVDPGNAKMRGLFADVLDRGAWRLAWLPPSLPYYELAGAYCDPGLAEFTKRLIFSAWTVVPKAVAIMTSYEAERRTLDAAGLSGRTHDEQRKTPKPLQYRTSGTTFALMYPSTALAAAGDPLALAREAGGGATLTRAEVVERVRGRISALTAKVEIAAETEGTADSRWYWVLPALLDRSEHGVSNSRFAAGLQQSVRQGGDDDGQHSGIDPHLDLLSKLHLLGPGTPASEFGLGAMPHDIVDVLAELAIAGPGVVALRALARVCNGPADYASTEIRADAFDIATGLRSMFNKPEIIVLLRAEDEGAYWRTVLEHCIDGCLQAVLDEYAHVLVESEGLQGFDGPARSATIAAAISDALSMRTSNPIIEDINVVDGRVEATAQRAASHFAVGYGRASSSDQAANRESQVRAAFNSPFRPFVLASTSVGQEGLDFHTYSHAVVHWNLPGNPVDLEQREGRVHRYKGHAVRKNVAADFRESAMAAADGDPWAAMFSAAASSRPPGESEIVPYWVYAREGGASIERYVPAVPLSRELQHQQRLLKTVVTYRLLLGQPRQDDLIKTMGDGAAWMPIDLAPPTARDVGLHR